MSNYWATFVKTGNHCFRYDTRIYLNAVQSISNSDICIGAVVGKNPGSASPSNLNSNAMQMINLNGDKLLPTVRNIFIKAKTQAKKPIGSNEYVQVLNLFYLCDNNLSTAITSYSTVGPCTSLIDSAENKIFPLVWYVWGSPDGRIDCYKQRFSGINTNNHIYYHTTNNQVYCGFPDTNPARHTQGLKHASIIPALAPFV